MGAILVVEDDAATAAALGDGLADAGFPAVICASGEECLAKLATGKVDALILDRMLPDCDGLELLARLRREGCALPVVLLTAMGEVEDRVEGFETGADDYLAKPFAFPELLARLKRLLRPTRPAGDSLRVQVGPLRIDLLDRVATVAGGELQLTQLEFDLLAKLAKSAGEVVSREELVSEVWRETNRATPIDNVVDVHIGRIRRKLEESGRERILHTIRGLGFQLGGDP